MSKKKADKITLEEANTLRLTAHEIIFKLLKGKCASDLRLLLAHCRSAVSEVEEGKEPK